MQPPAEWVADMVRHLSRQHTVLWPGVAFDLTDDKQLQAAAEWLATQCREAFETGYEDRG